MAFLHSNDIIHQKLSPSRIFLDEYFYPKIDDFGLYNLIYGDINTTSFSAPIYNSPELDQDTSIPTKESDVYSFSYILYELLTGTYPFNRKISWFKLMEMIINKNHRPEIPSSVPNSIKQLLSSCWSSNPKERPSFNIIADAIRNEPLLITDKIDKDEFLTYINFIDEYESTKEFIDFNEYLNNKGKLPPKNEEDVNEEENEEEEEEDEENIKLTMNIKKIDLSKYEKQNKIGEGSFGNVFTIIEKGTGNFYAAKIMKENINFQNKSSQINFYREVNIISKIDHPSILKFIGYSALDFKNHRNPVIVTELATRGTLGKIIEMEQRSCCIPEWDDTKKLINIYGIASSMLYLHLLNIIHRDLRPNNILVDNFLLPKLADFGLSKEFSTNDDENINQINSGFKGTPAYTAPEIWHMYDYSKAGDVYSFGFVVYEIITSEKIYPDIKNIMNFYFEIILKKIRPEFKYPIPKCYKKLIEDCWNEDPKQRPTFQMIVDSLKNDQDFITENVDREEYLNYVNYIDGYYQQQQNSTNDKQSFKIASIESDSNNKINDALKQWNKIIKSDDAFIIKIEDYEEQKKIGQGDFYKIYKVISKSTKFVYSAKVSDIDIKDLNESQIFNIYREVNFLSKIDHPSILHFIGFSPINFEKEPKPVIINEYSSDYTLEDILFYERTNKEKVKWNDTKKLINIYGIASVMSYLHSNNILHRDLKPSKVFLDKSLYPKLFDFGLSIKYHTEQSMTFQSTLGIKGYPAYSAPEILNSEEYTKASDVYSFALLTYEIITNKIPFKNLNDIGQIYNEVVINEARPSFEESTKFCYKMLIEKCWSQNQHERPSFEEIVHILKNDSSFITENIDEKEFHNYIHNIDEYNKTMNTNVNVFKLNLHKNKIIENTDAKVEENDKVNENDEVNENNEDKFYNDDVSQKDLKYIEQLLQTNQFKELYDHLKCNFDFDQISSIFDHLYQTMPFEKYSNFCQEGSKLNNAVALHKLSLLLIFRSTKKSDYDQAREFLKESISQGFTLSYFILARLLHEIYKEDKEAFHTAEEGSNKGNKYSKCLLGYFIAHGIGCKKDFRLGISIILESKAEDYYKIFATDIGIFYYQLDETDHNKAEAFKWFEIAYEMKKTNATVNNYGLCFLLGIHVSKNIEKAKEIFIDGSNKGFSSSMYHLSFIFEKTDKQKSYDYYQKAANQGSKHSKFQLLRDRNQNHI